MKSLLYQHDDDQIFFTAFLKKGSLQEESKPSAPPDNSPKHTTVPPCKADHTLPHLQPQTDQEPGHGRNQALHTLHTPQNCLGHWLLWHLTLHNSHRLHNCQGCCPRKRNGFQGSAAQRWCILPGIQQV